MWLEISKQKLRGGRHSEHGEIHFITYYSTHLAMVQSGQYAFDLMCMYICGQGIIRL